MDGDLKLPGGRDAVKAVDTWENGLGTELGSFVELVGEAHDTQGGGKIAVIILGVVVIDAGEEGGDEVSVRVVVDGLEEHGAAHFIVMVVTLFGKEALIELKRVSKIENAVVGPGQGLDGDRRIEPWNR